ncbi:MAG TPA: D-alanyl-D-alanine carboxypeptidase/D-alanyl-D-alanine-endopeptidase [Polyangiales bacterium]|nr:D-alanyl-D-alanine carboxypeptidase/D-alanyl-D-alanine-endopeptidase [Polyangiales bacterium]
MLQHAILTLAMLLVASVARADDARTQLAGRLAELVQKSGLGNGMGAVVTDAWSGERLYTLNPETPRNPASNMKLVTAATALVELGADRKLRTTVAGSIGPAGEVAQLVLRGEGDPSLAFEDLLAMAGKLSDVGVRTVDEIVVDGSYFDDQILPPAYEQQPKEIAAFRAAVAAVSVDRNAFELRVVPGAVDGAAGVRLRCPDHFAVESTLKTTPSGAPAVVAEQKQRGDQLGLKLSGSMPATVRSVGYERRVESPLPYAGHCMKAALRTRSIGGALNVRVGTVSEMPPTLLTHESAALAVLLQRVGKNSDNFYAEMLLKVIGAESTHRPGSSALGVTRARALLGAAGAPLDQATIVNGSGLFKGGAVSPAVLSKLLTHVWRDPSIRHEYVAQLAVAGKDGTLATRLADLKKPRVVRAKTGTLDDVVALSGYVLGPEQTLAFTFVFNGVSGKQWLARDTADAMVRTLVGYLYP